MNGRVTGRGVCSLSVSLPLVPMRLLLVLVLAAAAFPATAQTRLVPSPGALAVTGGTSGEAMHVTTVAASPSRAGRLSRRYRGVAVNRSPRTAAQSGRSGALAGVAMPALRAPEGDFVRRGGSSFRVVGGR